MKHCQRHNGLKAFYIDCNWVIFNSFNILSSKQKLQQALKSWSNFSVVLIGKGQEIQEDWSKFYQIEHLQIGFPSCYRRPISENCCFLLRIVSGIKRSGVMVMGKYGGTRAPNFGYDFWVQFRTSKDICCQVTPPMQSGRTTQVALNDLSIVHFTKWFPQFFHDPFVQIVTDIFPKSM